MARTGILRILSCIAVASLVASACTSDDDGDDATESDDSTIEVGPDGYGAEITRTSDGVPHVRAGDLEGVVFGQGYAGAQDHPCDLVDQIIEVFSQRSATFGPGEEDANLDSDFGWAAMGLVERAARDFESASDDERAIFEAYAAGWNTAFDEMGADGISDWCSGADWLRPVTAVEAYTYARSVLLLASGVRMVDYIATAQPPSQATADGDGAESAAEEPANAPGSNAWAVGSERSESGNALLVGNPHFPWVGELRFSEIHLSTEDGMDVYGAQLLGLPLVGLGFTEGVAWSHTVSAGRRLTAYSLELAPGDPTTYLVDGEPQPMTSEEVTVEVLGDDGTTSEESRTYWSTEYGPVIDFPGVGWTDTTAASYRDANIDNKEFIGQYLAMNRSESLEDLQAAHEQYQAVPLFNTVAVGADGTAWYADTSATPNLSAEAIAAYEQRLEDDPLTGLANEAGAVLLDGSTSRDAWIDDPEAPWPGVLPWDALPQVERSDYVMNANDSYWVTNADTTTPGEFSPLQGSAGTERSVRTLENLAVLSDTAEDGPAGEDGDFSLDEVVAAALRDGAYTEREWREGVVQRCAAATGPVMSAELTSEDGDVVVAPVEVDLTEACDVLEQWDGRYDVDSVGAVVWREFVEAVPRDELWGTEFDEADPGTTPNGISAPPADSPDPVLEALATSVAFLDHVGIALDTPLGEVQYDARVPDQKLAVPGGLGSEGLTNVVGEGSRSSSTTEELAEVPEQLVDGSTLTENGYPISFGTSFLFAVELTPDGPDARTILTYGQVGDPASPEYTDQVKLFADKEWKTALFTRDQIESDADSDSNDVIRVSA